jgi:FAD synthase
MSVAIFPGSFKPPHIGHFDIVKKLLKRKGVGRVVIVISKKPRPLINVRNVNKDELVDIVKGAKEGMTKAEIKELVPVFTQDQSYKMWMKYIKLLPTNDQKRIQVIKSQATSPVQNGEIIKLGKAEVKKGQKILFVKSAKDAGNSRYSFYEMTIGKKNIKYLVIKPTKRKDGHNVSSTFIRNSMLRGDHKKIKNLILTSSV